MAEIAETRGVRQSIVEAQKHPLNPVLRLGDIHEWDSMRASPWASRTVVYDEEDSLFKAWYYGSDGQPGPHRTGYATSGDGARWEKPALGLYEYNGSKENNISALGMGSVIKDPSEKDDSRRYKMIMKGSGAVRMGYSPDGIHWDTDTRLDMNAMLDARSLGLKGKFQSICTFVRDPQTDDPQRRYQLFWMTVHPTAKPGFEDKEWVRTKSMAFGPDELHWTGSEANPVLTPEGSKEVEDHLLGVIPYRGYYVMLYEYGWYSMSGTAGPYGSYCADVRLAVSRDGEHYTRVLPDQKVISRGRFGEWDDGFLIVSDKVAIKEDTMYLYYCGHDRNYPGFAGDMLHQPSRGYPKTAIGTKRVSQMGLATLLLDRFTCLETDDGEVSGFAVTTPIEVTDPGRTRLILNVSDTVPARSWVDVEVLDAHTLETLEGFSRSDCNGVDRDGLDMLVSWGHDRTLSGVEVRRIALRFWIYGAARLYSFAFDTT